MAEELILIIEDNPLNMKLLRDVVSAQGFRVVESGTAEEGLEVARTQRPDLILMDIQLPGMDGISALKQLKADLTTREIPVIAVTASAMPLERREILAAGFDGYQTKPLSVKELTVEIRSVLEAHARRDESSGTPPPPRRP
jgi:two-component system, cell cycle response regulator DivK